MARASTPPRDPSASVGSRRDRPGKAAILRSAVEVMGVDGYEGASIRDMAARAGVSVAALYYHFPSKLDLLHEFLVEAHDVTLARIRRRLLEVDDEPVARLDQAVATLIASHLHDGYARLASNVALHERTRLQGPEREAIDAKRRQVQELFEDLLHDGRERAGWEVPGVADAAQAVVTLCTAQVEPFEAGTRTMAEVIAVQQRLCRALAGAPVPVPARPSRRRQRPAATAR